MAAIEPVKGISDRGLSRLRRYSWVDASAQIVDKYWNPLENPVKKSEAEPAIPAQRLMQNVKTGFLLPIALLTGRFSTRIGDMR